MRQHGGMDEHRFWIEFGKRLRMVRKIKRVRQTGLAAKVGIHRNTLLRCEKGDAISLWVAARICEELGVQMDVMVRGLIDSEMRRAA